VSVKPFSDRKRRYIFLDYFCHNSPANRARGVFKPSRGAESLLVSIKTKVGKFWIWVFLLITS